MEKKSVQIASKVIDNRTVVGYAAVLGNVDSGRDRIFKGAFKGTIKEDGQRIRHLWQHNYYEPPIAKITSLKEVKAEDLPEEMTKDHPEIVGALEVTREYLNTPRAEEVFQGIASGAINEMSFAYDALQFDFEEDEDGKMVRNLRKLKLWDTSDVNWGMNMLTVGAKSKTEEKLVEIYQLIEKLGVGGITGLKWDSLSQGEKESVSNQLVKLSAELADSLREDVPQPMKMWDILNRLRILELETR